MKKCSRYVVSFIVVLFFLLICTPIYAYENTELWHNECVYDNGRELKKETQEEIENILKEFYNQTDINAIVVTLQYEKDKAGSEMIHEAMQEYGKDDVIVILFSIDRKLVYCSYNKISIFPYTKSILSVNYKEYDSFIEESVVNILKQIAQSENKKFSLQTEKVNLLELLSSEDLKSMIDIVIVIGSIIVIIFLVLILEIFIIRLCIEELLGKF